MRRRLDVPILRVAPLVLIALLCGCGASVTPQKHDGTGSSDVGGTSSVTHARNPDHPRLVGTCPVDIRVPIPNARCGDDRESSEGKWSEEDAEVWQSNDGPYHVEVVVRDGLIPCPESGETGEASDYRMEWNRQAQHCVRVLIEDIGGEMHSSPAPQVNSIAAELTWDHIQEVAELPQVMEVMDDGPLPGESRHP